VSTHRSAVVCYSTSSADTSSSDVELCGTWSPCRYVSVMKPAWCTVYLQFIESHTSTCSGLASSPSSGRKNLYMRQLVRVVRLSRLSAGLDGMEFHCIPARPQSTKMYNTYQLSHIYIVTSWWWAISKPEKCRDMLLNKLTINTTSGWFHYTHVSRFTVNKT
jgi:hypothetical protein